MKTQAKHDEWNAQQLIRIVRNRSRVIVIAAICGTVLAAAFQLFWPKTFESIAQVLVMRKDPRLAARGETARDSEVQVTEELLATHMQMLQSRKLVEGALTESGLITLPSIVDHLGANQKPAEFVIANMTLSRGGKGQSRAAHVLNVALRSTSESDAQALLQAIIKKYQSFLTETFQDVNQEAASLILQAQTELAADLQKAEADYEQFRQSSTNLMWKTGNAETTNIHRVRYEGILQELANLQLSYSDTAARLEALDDRLSRQSDSELSDLEKLSLVDEKNMTRVALLLMARKGELESPQFHAEQPHRIALVKAEYENLATMQLKENALYTEFGPSHPEMIGLRNQIGTLGRFMKEHESEIKSGRNSMDLDPSALFTAYHQLLKNDMEAMERREKRLTEAAEDAKRSASEMVTDEIQGESLRREVLRKQTLFDAAVDRLRDINLAKDYGGFINEVLAEPDLGLKVMPRLRYSLALGLLAFFSIASTGVAVAEYRDRRFRSLADLKSALQTTVLGKIPSQGNTNTRNASLLSKSATGDRRLPFVFDSTSSASDAFRMLRVSLMFTPGPKFRQIVCFTSPNAADGKSTTLGNLAVSLGQLGRKVLIIDCDLRRPSMHEFFSLKNDHGLTELVSSGQDPVDFIQDTQFSNVSLLPRGEAISNPAEFLAMGEFGRFLESLRDKFDHIFLDSPPILPVVDVLALAPLADASVVVIRIDSTTQLQAQSACASLRDVGAHIEGVIVNRMSGNALDEEYYGYGYGYGYYGDQYSSRYDAEDDSGSNSNGKHKGVQVAAQPRSLLKTFFNRNGNSNDHSRD